MTDLSSDVATILSKFGWAPTRLVDSSDIRDTCKTRGYAIFDSYIEIINNVRGLCLDFTETKEIYRPYEVVRFNPLICFTDCLRDARRRLRMKILPLAEVDHIGFFYMAEDHSFWLDMRELICIGKSFNEAMQVLLFRDEERERIRV